MDVKQSPEKFGRTVSFHIFDRDKLKEVAMDIVIEKLPPPFSTMARRKKLENSITKRRMSQSVSRSSGGNRNFETIDGVNTPRRGSCFKLPRKVAELYAKPAFKSPFLDPNFYAPHPSSSGSGDKFGESNIRPNSNGRNDRMEFNNQNTLPSNNQSIRIPQSLFHKTKEYPSKEGLFDEDKTYNLSSDTSPSVYESKNYTSSLNDQYNVSHHPSAPLWDKVNQNYKSTKPHTKVSYQEKENIQNKYLDQWEPLNKVDGFFEPNNEDYPDNKFTEQKSREVKQNIFFDNHVPPPVDTNVVDYSYDTVYYVPGQNKVGGRYVAHNDSIYVIDSNDVPYVNDIILQTADPTERVHFLLEGDHAQHPTSGDFDLVQPPALSTGLVDLGRLFIQMDTLKYLRIGPNGEILTSTSPSPTHSATSDSSTSNSRTSPNNTPDTVQQTTDLPQINDGVLDLKPKIDKQLKVSLPARTVSTECPTTTSTNESIELKKSIAAINPSLTQQTPSDKQIDGQQKEMGSPSRNSIVTIRDIPIWEEVARWVKFEEDVEPGSNRWSKPRVATLALHSLLELRSCILNGLFILDMEGSCFKDVEDILISSLMTAQQITPEMEEDVRKIIRAPHIPQYMKISNFKNVATTKHLFPTIASLPSMAAHQSAAILNQITDTGNGTDMGKSDMPARNSSPTQAMPTTKSNHPNHRPLGITSDDIQIVAKTKSMNKLKNYFAGAAAKTSLGGKKISSSARLRLQHSRTSPGPLSPTLHGALPGGSGNEIGAHDDEGINFPHPKFGNIHFMKKLPENAEAAHVLIGEAPFLKTPIIAFIRFLDAIYLADATEVPIPSRFIFLLIGPTGYVDRYYEIGRCLATLLSDEIFHEVSYKAKNIQDILAGVDEFLDHVIVLPPGEWDPTIRIQPPVNIPPQINRFKRQDKSGGADTEAKHLDHTDNTLVRTGRCCGGLIDDVKRKAPWYISDFKDAFSMQCVASFFFLYIACLAPIVTFGGLLSNATGHNLATIESLISGAICGITWALFSGQPLTIMGSTGPILVFESIVYSFCKDHGWNYLSFRCCIGLWTALILLFMVVTDASVLVKYVTRFTEELFASLISLIFVYQAMKNIWHIGKDFPVHRHKPLPPGFYKGIPTADPITAATVIASVMSNVTTTSQFANLSNSQGILVGNRFVPYISDVFFLSIVLFAGTFFFSAALKELRNTTFFPMSVRYMISDFAVLIAVVIALGVDYYYGLATPKLLVPSSFRPTSHNRHGWFVNPVNKQNPWWTTIATIFPALLATILIFLDQQITAVIVNRKENLLKKGCGYHLDLLVVSLLVIVCSLLGLPWFVAATVLSITHVNSLRLETECAAPGERPKFLGIREQRVTGLLIFIFIGLSVSMTKLLQFIPMPVLYGVFLYMGISSLKGVQFIQRISILFMPQKYQPDYMFLRSVKTYRVHIFTLIQLASLAALWAIKSYKSISICFPIMVAALVGIRKLMERIFTTRELSVLDDLMPDSEKKRKSIDETSSNESSFTGVQSKIGGGGGTNGGDNGKHGHHHHHHHHKKHQHHHQNLNSKKYRPIIRTPWQNFTNRFKKYLLLNHNEDLSNLAEAGSINMPNQQHHLDPKKFNNIINSSNSMLLPNSKSHVNGNNYLISEDPLKGLKGTYKPLLLLDGDNNDFTKSFKGNEENTLEQPLLDDKSGSDLNGLEYQETNFHALNPNHDIQTPRSTQLNQISTNQNNNKELETDINEKGVKTKQINNSKKKKADHQHHLAAPVTNKLPHVSSMIDAMNITREVEKTSVWKSLAKEKFLLNNSASTGNMQTRDIKSNNQNHKHSTTQNYQEKKHSGTSTKLPSHSVRKENETHLPPPSSSKFNIKIGSDDDDDLNLRNSTSESPILRRSKFDSVLIDPAKISLPENSEDDLETSATQNFADKAYANAADMAPLMFKTKQVHKH